MQMDHATSYASFNTICYLLIQGNICPRFNFAPFRSPCLWENLKLGKLHWLKLSLFKNNLL